MDGGNEANFAKIGMFILAGVLLIAGTLVYIGTSRGEKNEFLVETYFKNDVSGLDVGSAVNFRGVRIGAVKEISFVGSEYENVPPHQARNIYVLLALDSRRCREAERGSDGSNEAHAGQRPAFHCLGLRNNGPFQDRAEFPEGCGLGREGPVEGAPHGHSACAVHIRERRGQRVEGDAAAGQDGFCRRVEQHRPPDVKRRRIVRGYRRDRGDGARQDRHDHREHGRGCVVTPFVLGRDTRQSVASSALARRRAS